MDNAGSTNYQAGVVLQVTPTELIVHEWVPNAKRTRWAPRFVNENGTFKDTNKQPAGYQPRVISTTPGEVLTTGKMKGSVLSDDTKRRLRAKGYSWALPAE